jgi:hypothetical protein
MPSTQDQFCYEDAIRDTTEDWFSTPRCGYWDRPASVQTFSSLELFWQYPEAAASVCVAEPALTTEQRFRKLADKWSSEVSTISSPRDLVSHPCYREIIKLGWDVVPYLLEDLQHNDGYWFEALHEITRIQPFDRNDAGNVKRMTAAWVAWGKRKRKGNI